jgi:alpha-amylase
MTNLSERAIATDFYNVLNHSSLLGSEVNTLNTVSLNAYKKLKNDFKFSEIDNYKLAEKCEDGVIFHAWNWSFNSIKNNMEELAQSGFTSVQVSPIQPNKIEGTANNCDWWKLYQPIDFSIGNVLGSASDFKEMCDVAKKFGIKIIVDVVANHLANNTGKGNHAKWDRYNKIPSFLKDNDNFWHNESNGGFNYNNNDRTSMTQGAIGMPGLNTANKELQNYIIGFINKAQDLGADGFRFDAAKHIELPTDQVASDFWPSITNGIKSKDSDAFIYGEILNECATDIKNYTKYMKVTDNQYGWNVLDSVLHCNAGLAQNYYKQDCPNNFITWVESHDTYAGDYGRKSDVVSEEDIRLGWCIISARAESVPLFYNRPINGLNGKLGDTGNNAWKHKTIAAINKFHNHFAGQNEYIRILNYNTVFEIERGDSGVVIANLSYNNTTINTETNLKDGEYTDRVSGKKVIVKNGYLTAELSGKSVIIAYNENSESKVSDGNFNSDLISGYLYATKPSNWTDKIYAYVYSENKLSNKCIMNWPGVEMQYNGNEYYYELPLDWQNENTQVIFNDGHNQMPMAFTPGQYYLNGTAMYFNSEVINYIRPTQIINEQLHNKYISLISQTMQNASIG